jgi:hypothetical protein
MYALHRLGAASLMLAALMYPASASASPVAAASNAGGSATVLRPLILLKSQDLDFGPLIVAAAGTAVIDPLSGSTTTTGGVTKVGTSAHPAVFTTTGSRNANVHIRIPTNPITLTRVGGGGTMTVSDWTLDGNQNRRIPLTTGFNFAVGATLNLAAGQPDGTYTGTFTVTVQYP